MKRILLASLLAALLFCCAKHSEAQTIQYVYSAVTHNSTTVSTSCGDFLSSCNIIGTGAQFHQLSWNVSGTLSACTVRVDSSTDNITWNVGDIIAAQTCTSNGNVTSTAHTVNYTRVNITAITPTGSASLTTNLTGYANNPAGGSGGTVTNTGGALTANSVVLGAGGNDTKVATGIVTTGTNNSELDLGVSGTNGVLGLNGSTSGKFTMTAPAVAGTATNPATVSNVIASPDGSNTNPAYGSSVSNKGLYFNANNTSQALIEIATTDIMAFSAGNGPTIRSDFGLGWGSTTNINGATTWDTELSRSAAGIVAVGISNIAGNEAGLLRDANACRVTADITLPVNTATTVCTWSLPAVAKAWAWQCKIPWVISAGTGTNTLTIIANASQTPTGTTNGMAEIKTSNTNTATEAVTAISASGATTLLTSGTITPAATVFQSSTSGTLLASGTAGTFAIQMTAAGTTATAAAKAGASCILY